MSVVLAEADALSARQLRRLLEPFAQLEVVGVAGDGYEAIEMVDRLEPDLMFIDLEMSKLDGFQVLRALNHKPVVVAMTAQGRYRHMVAETDAVDCLCKPLDAEQIQRVMSKIDRMVRVLGRLAGRPYQT